ncbi:MAG: lysine--tRNA ligase [Candidatus Puniceispirillum sp.]
MTDLIADLKAIASDAKAWPFAEARALASRMDKQGAKDTVLFETGYGPSGLPHIGTFGEVVRTTMVRHAYETLTGQPTRLVCFSDDMDGFRKIPDNVPNHDMLKDYLNMPLTKVKDPFGTAPSFGEHNNLRLQAFLDSFGFDYEFMSSTSCYQAGVFDAALRRVLEKYDAIMDIMLPTLGPERQATYSPFFPICPDSGKVLQAKVVSTDVAAGTIVYIDPDSGAEREIGVTGGQCKLQWKCDWAMRWYALGVDYEMSGKDLIDSVTQSSKITRALGGTPPGGISYELFLDANGEKISKSKGNGLSVEDWLRYGSPESLALFMYGQPKRAKRLHFDVIPKTVDEYYQHLAKLPDQSAAEQVENPLWHIHSGIPKQAGMPVSFSLLLNLAAVCHAEDPAIVWAYVSDYVDGVGPDTHPELDRMIGYAVHYYQDMVRPNKIYRLPDRAEAGHLAALAAALAALDGDDSAEAIQSVVYATGKAADYENLRDWFKCLYEVLLGQAEGPRMGSFFALYGRSKSIRLIEDALAGKLADTTSVVRES